MYVNNHNVFLTGEFNTCNLKNIVGNAKRIGDWFHIPIPPFGNDHKASLRNVCYQTMSSLLLYTTGKAKISTLGLQ
ncbi:MAG: hypothetical protein ABI861_08065 [Panacibacter sp.]